MYGGEFDGAAAFSGGGFMPSQATQNVDPLPSVLSKHRDTQTLTPLTANQINKALLSNDDKVNFLIDGVDVHHVKLVGMVMNMSERTTDVSFMLDDFTGRVECNRWLHDPVDTKEMISIQNGMYVRINGDLKVFQGKKQIVVYGIKPVTDFDEVTHHFVECIYVHAYNTKLTKQRASSSNQTHTQTYQTATSNQFAGQYVADARQGIDKMVLDYLLLPVSLARESGVHKEELVKQLGIPLDKIEVTLNCLTDEGLVYTSIDDNHYKCAADA